MIVHPPKINANRFIEIVRDTPLVSIDLIVRPKDDSVLLGHRRNEPARGFWFVPGGRVHKNERLEAAFERITDGEIGLRHSLGQAEFVGVYEHHYSTNFALEPGIGTHYVVLAYEIRVGPRPQVRPDGQHARLRFADVDELLADASVHPYTKAYFK